MPSAFTPRATPQAPTDPLFGLINSYNDDPSESKIDLSIGAYRDEDGDFWVLPAVEKAAAIVTQAPGYNHEYLPIAGLPAFISAAQKTCLGSGSRVLKEKRITSIQTISGTGALSLGANFLSRFYRPQDTDDIPTVYMSSPTWSNHPGIFSHARLPLANYRYFSPLTNSIDFNGMLSDLSAAPSQSIILLHACAHNPTGVDPTPQQWQQIAEVIAQKRHFAFFDMAYQGFASGSLESDAAAIRLFAERGLEFCVAQSFAKSCGIYGQRVGCFHFITSPASEADVQDIIGRVGSQLSALQRVLISNPPAYGARVVSKMLNTPALFEEWQENLRVMSGRIIEMRQRLRYRLEELGTPGSWSHITDQIGMFSLTGLSREQSLKMQEEHLYMPLNGRISMAGLNSRNIDRFARAVDRVIRETA